MKMAEYINREAFLKAIEERYCLPCKDAGKDHNGCKCRACWVDDMRGEVIDAPAADVAPVVHGRWIDGGDYVTAAYGSLPVNMCSECHMDVTLEDFDSYCPNCGARMDGDSYAKAD